MSLELKSTKDLDITSPRINLLVYGESGIGKTVFASTASQLEKCSPALLIDVESGVMSAATMGIEIDYVTVNDLPELQAAMELGLGGKYKTVIIDSLTELQKKLMSVLLKKAAIKDPSRDPYIAQMQDWGKNLELMRRIIMKMRDSSVHFIANALMSADRDERTGVVTNRPQLPGRLGNELAAFFDIVGALIASDKKEYFNRLVVRNAASYIVKDRTNRLPDDMYGPTITKIFNFLGGKPNVPETNNRPK